MFYHVVMFKLKENSKREYGKGKGAASGHGGEIPQLKHLVVGQDELFTEEATGHLPHFRL